MSFPGRHFTRNLIEGRTLLIQLVRRDFKQRFVGSAAGWLWSIIQPLVLLVSWTFVFQVCLEQRLPPGAVTDNYTIFLFCGFLPWLLFQETVMRSASSLVEHSNLITKTVFPSEILPVTIFLSSFISHLIGLAFLLAAVAIWGGGVSPMALFLPIYILPLAMLAIGLGWLVSSLQVYLRDTVQILTIVMTFWFWMTPIFIQEEQIPDRLQFVVRYNPLAYVVRAYRERLMSFEPLSIGEFGVLCCYATAFFVGGGLFFRHVKRGFADVL